jgi:hypothetical protein
MALNFQVYESATLEVLGTLKSVAGTGGKLRFTNKSMNANGSLCVVIEKKDGKSATATCSKVVSAAIRKALAAGKTKQEALAAIVDLDIVEAPNGGNYISAPRGEGGEVESFTIAALAKEVFSFEELVAF